MPARHRHQLLENWQHPSALNRTVEAAGRQNPEGGSLLEAGSVPQGVRDGLSRVALVVGHAHVHLELLLGNPPQLVQVLLALHHESRPHAHCAAQCGAHELAAQCKFAHCTTSIGAAIGDATQLVQVFLAQPHEARLLHSTAQHI